MKFSPSTLFSAKTIAAAAFAIVGLSVTAESASALTTAPVAPAASVLLQQASWGCGPGWHPTPWGRCVPNARPVYGYGYHPRYRAYPAGRPYYPHRWHRY